MKFLDFELSEWYCSDDGKYAARFGINKNAAYGAYFWIYDSTFNNDDIWCCAMKHPLPYKDLFEKIHDNIYYKDNYTLKEMIHLLDNSIIKINKLKLFI